MRVLIIGDSHGLGMEEYLYNVDTALDIMNLSQSGGRVSAAAVVVTQRLREIQLFSPDFVIFILGHNSVMEHPNPLRRVPKDWGKSMFVKLMEVGLALSIYLPGLQVYYTCMYPRLPSRYLDVSSAESYNRLTIRLGRYMQQMRRNAITRGLWGFEVIFCENLWDNIMLNKASEELLSSRDGLHLNPRGKCYVAEMWSRALRGWWFE